MVNYVARQIFNVVRIPGDDTADRGLLIPHKAASADNHNTPANRIIPLEAFIINLVNGANVQVSTLLTTLIYLERLRARIPAMSQSLSATPA
jgi:PHO85 cyclin-1